MRRIACALLLLLAACGPSGESPRSPSGTDGRTGFEVIGDTLSLAFGEGRRAHWVGAVGPGGEPAFPSALILEEADGAMTTIAYASADRPAEILVPDGSGFRLERAGEGLVRVRGWIPTGEVVFDELVAATLPDRGLSAARAASYGLLTARVRLLDCDGVPSGALVQQAVSATVVVHGPNGLWRIPRIARREAGEFVAEFPLDPGLGNLDVWDCQKVVDGLREPGKLCDTLQAAAGAVCKVATTPQVAALCATLEALLVTICLLNDLTVEWACPTEPENRPHSPLGTDGSLVNAAAEATVRLYACGGYVERRSGRTPLAERQADVTLTVDGCAGAAEGVRAAGFVSSGPVTIFGGGTEYRVYEFGEETGYRETEVTGHETVSRLSPEDLLEKCEIHSSETGDLLARFETVETASLRIRAQPEGGQLSLTGSVDRRYERIRQPTVEEEESYDAQIDACLAPKWYEVGGAQLLAVIQLLPMQRVKITVRAKGDLTGEAALGTSRLDSRPLLPGGEIVFETTYEEIEEDLLGDFGLEPWDLPEGMTFPDGTKAPFCQMAMLQIRADASVLHEAAGAKEFDARVEYSIEILEE